MNKIAFLFLIGLLAYPNFAVGKLIDTDRVTVEGRILTGASVLDIEADETQVYNAQFHLDTIVHITKNIELGGRLDGYTYWGDYAEDCSDVIRTERVYLNWRNLVQSNLSLAAGRRPSFYDLTSDGSIDALLPGTPFGHTSDINIDGVAVGYSLSQFTNVPGMSVQIIYGRGFDSEWGNDNRLRNQFSKYLSDSYLGGLSFDVYKSKKTFLQLSYFRAEDVNDGVGGTVVFPIQFVNLFAPTLYADIQKFPIFNFSTYGTPVTTIGDINQIELNAVHTLDNEVTLFASLATTQLRSNGQAGLYGGLGHDAVYEAVLSDDGSEILMVPVRTEDDDPLNGYGVYLGIQVPAPMGRFGLEYNYGSKYWTPFIRNQDELLSNKLTTRGHAAEVYYTLDVNHYAQIRVGTIYYDFDYTGSGSPVGRPTSIKDIQNGDAYSLMPVVDTAWNSYIKLTFHF